jgi:hypothetical protein
VRVNIEGVNAWKSSRQTNLCVERELMAGPYRLCLVADHSWDGLGAAAGGWKAELIERPGNTVLDHGPHPLSVGDDLSDVSDRLIARYKKRP